MISYKHDNMITEHNNNTCRHKLITTSPRVGGDVFELYCVEFPSDNRDAGGFREGNIGAVRDNINGIKFWYMGSRA